MYSHEEKAAGVSINDHKVDSNSDAKESVKNVLSSTPRGRTQKDP